MRVLLAIEDPEKTEELRTLFERHHKCVVDIADIADDYEALRAQIEYATPTWAVTDTELTGLFYKAINNANLNGRKIIHTTTNKMRKVPVSIPDLFTALANDNDLENGIPLKSGDVELNTLRNHCTRGGQDVRLTDTEYKILRYLMLNAGRTVNTQELKSALYETPEEKEDEDIRSPVSKLRKKLGPNFITTSVKNGYSVQHENDGIVIATKGPITLYADYTVTYDGTPVKGINKQFKILSALVKHPERLFKACTSQILDIKNAISEASKSYQYPYGLDVIQNVYGKGYKWQNPQPRKKPQQGAKSLGKLNRDDGIIVEWSGQLRINTRTGEMINLGTSDENTAYLTPKGCEIIEYTVNNPGWKTSSPQAQRPKNVMQFTRKLKDIGLDRHDFMSSGKPGRGKSSGYAFIGDYTVQEVSRETAPAPATAPRNDDPAIPAIG